jgi:hypothetical protein
MIDVPVLFVSERDIENSNKEKLRQREKEIERERTVYQWILHGEDMKENISSTHFEE